MRYVHGLLQKRPLQRFRIDYPGSPLYAQQKAAFCSSWDGEYLFWSVLGLILAYEAHLVVDFSHSKVLRAMSPKTIH